MNQIIGNPAVSPLIDEAGYGPIEERLRATVRATIEAMFAEEPASFLGRLRYDRGDGPLNRPGFTGGSEVSMDGAYGTRQQSEPLYT